MLLQLRDIELIGAAVCDMFMLDVLSYLCPEYESKISRFHHVRKAKSLNIASQAAPFQPGSDWRLTRTPVQDAWTSASRQS